MNPVLRDLTLPGDEIIETHISWVLLREHDVWKIKKPVSLGFLDFSTLEKRFAACKAEVELNRRLAADVYRACVPITRDSAGRHQLGGEGEPVEWAVHMVRLPTDQRADIRLAEGRLKAEDLKRIADRLAAFHAAAKSDRQTARFGSVEVISANLRENFEQTRHSLPTILNPQQADEIEAWQTGFLERHADLFASRQTDGRVRDGHGDLRLEHIYLGTEGEILVLDCIEFNHRFRFADICADIAFLAMDLAWHDRPDLAERFLADYARASNDYGLYLLVEFYESYRAFVRGKIASFVAQDPQSSYETRQRMSKEARKYFLLAQAAGRRSLMPPRLIAIGGIIASGKSSVSEKLGAKLLAPVIEADRTRKATLGLEATTPLHVAAWSGPYSAEQTERTYEELWKRADAVLSSGRSVIIDASFRCRAMRQAAGKLAQRHGVPFLFVECRADHALCRQRLKERAHSAATSDGRLEIFDDFVAAWEPAHEVAEHEHLVLDTTLPIELNLEKLLGHLGMGDFLS